MNPADLDPEVGWLAMGPWPFPHGKPGRFVSGDDSGERFQIRYYKDGGDERTLRGKVWFGPGAEGPPLHAHGGAMAAVLDEACGMSCWIRGIPVIAKTLATSFHTMLPLGKVLWIRATYEEVSDTDMLIRGELFLDETIYASAEAVFARIRGKTLDIIRDSVAKRES